GRECASRTGPDQPPRSAERNAAIPAASSMNGTPCSASAARTSGGIFATIAVPSQGGYSRDDARTPGRLRASDATACDSAAFAAAYAVCPAFTKGLVQLAPVTLSR